MRTFTSLLTVVTSLIVALGCSSPSSPAETDGGLRDDSAIRTDSGNLTDGGNDAARPIADSGSSSDGGGDSGIWTGPPPPVGTALCGTGTVSDEALRMACSDLDPMSDLSTGVMTDCDALVTDGVAYEVWCSTNTIFLRFSSSAIDDPSKRTCTRTITDSEGVVHTITTDVFRWGSSGSPDTAVVLVFANGSRTLSTVASVPLWTSRGVSGDGEEDPWAMSYDYTASGLSADATASGSGLVVMSLQQIDCDDIPISGSSRYVLTIPIRWETP